MYRPLDIQTSDSGPGVSSHEQMTQIRMGEYFMVNYLELQWRFHYAPNDSLCHIVEKVMRSLNECLGMEGLYLFLALQLFMTKVNSNLKNWVSMIWRDCRLSTKKKISKDCAEEIKKRFDGKACMGTSIHDKTPWFDDYQKFFFDEKYMVKCAGATSSAMQAENSPPPHHFSNGLSLNILDLCQWNGGRGVPRGVLPPKSPSECPSGNQLPFSNRVFEAAMLEE